MRNFLAIVAGLFLCATVSAAGIPSSASGVYLTPDRVCRVVFQRYAVSWLQADLVCMQFSGVVSSSLTTVYAPGAQACWPDSVAVQLERPSQVNYVAWRGFNGTALSANVGNPAEIVNGGGTGQSWQRITAVASPAPYTCASAGHPQDPACRYYGQGCGG